MFNNIPKQGERGEVRETFNKTYYVIFGVVLLTLLISLVFVTKYKKKKDTKYIKKLHINV